MRIDKQLNAHLRSTLDYMQLDLKKNKPDLFSVKRWDNAEIRTTNDSTNN